VRNQAGLMMNPMTNLAILKGDENRPPLTAGATPAERPEILIEPRKILVQNIGELLEKHKNLPEEKKLWRGIKENSFGFIYGAPKSGKSSLCECLAISIAAGKNTFLGTPLDALGPVAYISLEESERSRIARNSLQIQSLSESELELLKTNFKVSNDELPITIHTDYHWQLLEENIAFSGAKIVIIDSLTHLCTGQIESSADAQKIVVRLKTLVNKLGITLICIHHTPKNNEKPLTIDSLAGSHVLSQGADFIIGVKSIYNQRYIKDVVYRHAKAEEEVLTFEITDSREIRKIGTANESDILQQPGMSLAKKSKSNDAILLDHLITFGKTPANNLIFEFTEMREEMSRATVFNCLKRLQDNNRIQKDDQGNYYVPTDSLKSNAVPEASETLDLDSADQASAVSA
jgi:KaiC/GvpD/RAD55 family RecA-like ATPase